MRGRHAVLSTKRAAVHCIPAASGSRPALPQQVYVAALAIVPYRRYFAASGPHFNGFPFGGRFPGGTPPRGESDKFYRLLELEKGASDADIKQAYKKQAMKHHPDRGGDESTFKEISRAYEVLSNPEKKQIYDTYGEEGLEGAEKGTGGAHPGMDPFDLFGQIFGFNPGGRRTQRGRPMTPDSTYDLHLSLEELYMGTTRNIVFTRDALCSACKGQGGHDRRQCSRCEGTGRQVTMQQMGMFVQQTESVCPACRGKGYIIPPGKDCKTCKGKCTTKEKATFSLDIERGVQDGTEYRFQGQADEAPGHDTGDVVIAIRQKTHPTFQRVKDSLLMSKKISLSEALCGFQFSAPFLDGEELVIRSTPGEVVRPGDILVLPGRGMPRPHGQKPGDLFLALEVEFPESLSPERQRRLLEILDGRPVPEEPPSNAEAPQKLNKRKAQELRDSVRRASGQERAQQQGEGAQSCVQQ